MRRWGVWGARGGMVLVSRECVVVVVFDLLCIGVG